MVLENLISSWVSYPVALLRLTEPKKDQKPNRCGKSNYIPLSSALIGFLISTEELVNINDIEYMLMKFAKVKNSDISEPKEEGLVYENPLLIDNGEKYEEKPQEVMPDCCKIHREEFMTTLKFDQFKQNEQKIPLILASNLALYDTSKISQKLADNSFNIFKVKNSDYDALDKISSENKYILNRYRFS